MQNDVKHIIRSSYFHLSALFVIAVALVSTGVLANWRVNFVLFAVILGVFGYALVPKDKPVRIPIWLLYAALVGAVLLRIIPYLHNAVPLGYDPGWHKYPFEHPFSDQWVKAVFPLPFLLLMSGLTALFGAWFVLVPLFILFSASTGFMLYYVLKRLFNRDVAIISALLFLVSIAQFETFAYNYYKNVLGILLLLASFLFIEDNKRLNWKLILIGGLLAGVHQPAFFIFGVTYFVYTLLGVRKQGFKHAVLNGALIIVLGAVLNFDRIGTLYVPEFFAVVSSVANLEGGAGSFFDVKTYFFYMLPFIPFAITGVLHAWRKHVPVTIAGVLVSSFVLLDLFFHNRFIIYLDIFVIIFAAIGLLVLLQDNREYGSIVLYAFLALSVCLVVVHAFAARPLISSQELSDIGSIGAAVPQNATVMATDRYYSAWLKGYVPRTIVAPGLFDEDNMTRIEWQQFWGGQNRQMYLNRYQYPIYIYVGRHQLQYNFSDVCMPTQLPTATLYACT